MSKSSSSSEDLYRFSSDGHGLSSLEEEVEPLDVLMFESAMSASAGEV